MSSKAFHSEDAADRYDAWFERNAAMLRSKLACIRDIFPFTGDWIEIGVGTGRFAAVLSIKVGVEPEPVMGVRELKQRLSVGDIVLIDVRPEQEYASGHIPGALSYPLKELEKKIRELPKKKRILAYCRGR